ncbi:MAG: adenylyltransferase/cytidyltransferase family protein [Pseudomonadales bacterium]|nr:adenylyltransferase/cytidyltransferase family protein [Pseudomonadales bacterium]
MTNNQAISSAHLPDKIQKVIDLSLANLKKIILVTGVFDVLHLEHEVFLKKAKQLGDVLIVAIESDFRVRQIKGESRPINHQEKRISNLLSLGITDYVFILPDDFGHSKNHIDLIKTVRPSVLAVSSHTAHLDKKKAIMKLVGGRVLIIHQHNPNVSSTSIINHSGF